MDSIQDGRHARAASNAGAAVPYFANGNPPTWPGPSSAANWT